MSDEELLAHAEAMIISVDRVDGSQAEILKKMKAWHLASIAASLLVIARNSVEKIEQVKPVEQKESIGKDTSPSKETKSWGLTI